MRKQLLTALLTAVMAITTAAQAEENYFEPGQCYLYTSQLSTWNAGEVVKVTSQEVVFKNIVRIFKQDPDDPVKSLGEQDKVLTAYLNGTNRNYIAKALAEEVSYSRAVMTAIKVPNCK